MASDSRLTTRVTASGVLAVYSGRARVGYLVHDRRWSWELHLVSEQMRGHPRGAATEQRDAMEQMERWLERWMAAAGMEWRT